MGAQVTVVNATPYTWHFATQDRGFTRVGAGCRTSYEEKRLIHRYIYVRYDHHTWNSFKYEFNTHKGDTSFILRETYDRSQIQMHCTSEGGTHYCPNYGKFLQVDQFSTTLYSLKFVHPRPSHPYVLVEHPIPDLFPLCCYNKAALFWEGFPLDFGAWLCVQSTTDVAFENACRKKKGSRVVRWDALAQEIHDHVTY